MARRKKRPRRAPLSPEARAKAIANLKPAQPGEVRNPSGKNGSDWLMAFRDFFAEVPNEKLPKGAPAREESDTRYKIALRSLFRNVVRGSEGSLKLAIEQMQGRARQSVEHTGKDGGPIAVANDERMTTEEMRRELAALMGETPVDGGPLRQDDDDDDE